MVEVQVSALALLILFGSNFVAYVVATAYRASKRLQDGGRLFSLTPSGDSGRVGVLKATPDSMLELSKELAILGCILLYVWLCENRPLHSQGHKSHDMDFYWFLSALLIVVSLFTIERDPKEKHDILNRDQTEEWKGWMQVAFLLYHYFEASEVYNSVRVMISCYVWMTGFGNMSFFYIKRDFGFVRFYQMFWRLNFLVVLLCMLTNNMYILYYICPLHTFYFFLTFAVMRVYPAVNHSKRGLRIKIAICGFLIWAIWEFPWVFNTVFGFLDNSDHPGAAVGANGVRYEWYFRSGLDHYSTFFGLIFALNFPQASNWLQKVESLPVAQQVVAKGVPAVILVSATIWWGYNILPLPKLQYNALHPYFFIIPLTTYIFLRNITPELRKVHLGLLASIGKVTLETYLMQHHIWLTSNAKTLLVLVPGYPKLNFILVTVVYVAISRRLYRLTISLRARLIPEEPTKAFKWMLATMASVGFSLGLAALLTAMEAGPLIVGLVILVLAGTILSAASLCLRPGGMATVAHNLMNNRLSVVFNGFVILLGAGVVFFPTQLYGYEPEVPPLGKGCIPYVNSGEWVFDPTFCDEKILSTCTATRWEWSVPRTCRFSKMSSKSALKATQYTSTLFLGDENVFRLYAATVRTADDDVSIPRVAADHKTDIVTAEGSAHTAFRYTSTDGFEEIKTALNKIISSKSPMAVPNTIVLGSSQFKRVGELQDLTMAMKRLRNKFSAMEVFVVLPTAVSTKREPVLSSNTPSEEDVETIVKLLQSEDGLTASATGVVDLYSISKARPDAALTATVYREDIYDAGSQILLNAINVIHNTPKPKNKTSGVGIAHSPLNGLLLLALAGVMLLTMDNYVVSFIVNKFVGLPSITWEESVRDLHKAIGVGQYQHENDNLEKEEEMQPLNASPE